MRDRDEQTIVPILEAAMIHAITKELETPFLFEDLIERTVDGSKKW